MKVVGRPPLGAVYTWGNTLYVSHPPHGKRHNLTPDLMAHEEVHSRQQRMMSLSEGACEPAEWWDEWLHNPRFRLIQELSAYKVQFSYFLTCGREERRFALRALAKDLSGPMYGRIIKYADAMEAIKSGNA